MDTNIKILLGPSKMGQKAITKLEKNGYEVIPNPYGRKLKRDELIALLGKEVQGLIAGLEILDKDILNSSNLKVISRCGSGISNVDLTAVNELHINFSFTPFGPTDSVAELTVGNILCLLRNIVINNKKLHNGIWEKNMGNLLKGKTVLIIGYGKIGQEVARLLKVFHVNIIVSDPYLDNTDIKDDIRNLELKSALPLADIVLIHVSGDSELIGAAEFKIMKRGSYLLNASRGDVVDETSLIQALKEEILSGVWLDVFNYEPYNGPLCGLDNVILSPHIASYTSEGRETMENEAVDNLIKGFKV